MFGLIHRWRRRQLERRPFPDEWHTHLDAHVSFLRCCEGDLTERFLTYLKVFVWEKHWIGAGGMAITDEVKVVISAAAARLVLYLDLSYYDRLTEIVVYPSHYKHPDDDDTIMLGEAHVWGTVVLSWQAVLHGLHNPADGHDTATHEFAHVLDRYGGAGANGTPRLRASADYRPWGEVMERHYLALRAGEPKEREALRMYGATNEAEFFAVATEAFFERGRVMLENMPDLYKTLRRFYGFDPARCAWGKPEAAVKHRRFA